MSVTMKDVCHIDSLQSAQTIAGYQGQDNLVNNVMIMEAPDVERWITPHELLITALPGFDQLSVTELSKFMETLHKNSCSALIVKMTRFITQIPQTIVTQCDHYQIPLIQIPETIRYSDILLQVMQLLFNEKNRLLDQYKTINQQFVNLAIHGGSMQSIADMLATLIHNPVTIFQVKDNIEQAIVHSKNSTNDSALVQFTKRQPLPKKGYTNYQYYQAPLMNSTVQQLIVKIPQSRVDEVYLGIFIQREPIRDIDFMAIENAVNFTQMEALKRSAVKQSMRTYANDIIDDLINGKITTQEQFDSTLAHFKLVANQDYRITVIQTIQDGQLRPEYFTDHPKEADRIVNLFKRYWPETIYRIRQNRIILIFENKPTSIHQIKVQLTQILDHLQSESQKQYFQIGISEACHPNQFKDYSLQALKTLQIASGLYKRSFTLTYNDLGFYRFLFNTTDINQLRSFIPEELMELYENKPDLYQTLQVYLEKNQNTKESANALFIHPKTMSYRLAKIKERTGINLADVDEAFRINVGIRILTIFNNHTLQGDEFFANH